MSTLSPGSRGSSPGGLSVHTTSGSRPTTPQKRPGSSGAFFTTVQDPQDAKSLDLSGSRGKSSSAASSPGILESPVSRHESGGKLEARPWGSRSSHTRLVIKGGRIVNDDVISEGDVYIEDGIIKQVGKDLIIPGGTKSIDARGKFVIPGGIDANVHLQLPFMGAKTVDDFYQGTKAALSGGTTMIVCCALDQGSLLESYEKWRSLADEKVCCDYGLTVAVTSWSPAVQTEMELLAREKGISAFDVYMSYKGSLMLRDDSLIEVLKTCKNLGAFVRVHAENGDIVAENEKRLLAAGITGPEAVLLSRPDEIEAEATHRAIVLANQLNCPVYIQRMTSKSAVDILALKRKDGCICMGEVLAAGLASDGSNYYNKCWNHAAFHVTCPPLRADPKTPDILIDHLAHGNLQVVSSDHRPFGSAQKGAGTNDFTLIPHGVNGVEERMTIVWHQGVNSGKLDPCKFVAVTSANAAKYFNIYPRKGRIAAGSDADVVIWNPNTKKTISVKNQLSQSEFNVFEGLEVAGVPEVVISQGRIILEDGQLHVSQGVGHFVATPPFSPFIYVPLHDKEKGKVQKSPVDGPPSGERGAHSPTSSAGDSYQNGDEVDDEFRARKMHLPLQSPGPGQQEFHTRPPTRSGTRNLQDSSFSLSGAQFDDNKSPRSGIRVHNPPGGRSTGLW